MPPGRRADFRMDDPLAQACLRLRASLPVSSKRWEAWGDGLEDYLLLRAYTARLAMPSSCSARMMRSAISPRLAIRTFLNIGLSF